MDSRADSAEKRVPRRVAALLVAVALAAVPVSGVPVAGASPAAPSGPGQESGARVQEEYDEILAEEQALSAELEEIVTRTAELEAELADLEGQLDSAERTQLLARVARLEAEGTARERNLVAARSREEVRRSWELLEHQTVASYVAGGSQQSRIGALLRAESSSDADDALTYATVVLGDTDATVARLEAADARQAEAVGEAKQAEADARRHAFDAQQATELISTARDAQEQIVEETKQQAVLKAEMLEEIQARKVALQARITAMMRSSDGVESLLSSFQAGQPAYEPGVYEVTTPMPGRRIGSKFGPRHHPILAITRLHAGGDIGAPTGTPIHSVADGIVIFAGPRGGYGNTVVISHGHSLGTVYAHQSVIEVAAGDLVRRGDRIGQVGSTGLSTGPHLHFETRIKGVPVDPEGIVDWVAEVSYPLPPETRAGS